MYIESLLKTAPYALQQKEKMSLFLRALQESLSHHYTNCPFFKKFCDHKRVKPPFERLSLEEVPYIPSQVFKRINLVSSYAENDLKTIHSSATTSNRPSTVVLDAVTRSRQMKSLMGVLSHYLGTHRRPFLIMDLDPAISQGTQLLSARNAAIRGFLMAASQAYYCMKNEKEDQLSIDFDQIERVLLEIRNATNPPVLMGYTYVLYEYVAKRLLNKSKTYQLPKGTQVLHIGGWKKLKDKAVSKEKFNQTMAHVFGVEEDAILDAYGFTEQLGIVYIDKGGAHKRCPAMAEIVVRDTQTLQPLPDGEVGFVEFITPLPYSYPGVAVLLEDLGRVVSREPSWRGEHGTTFEILGRSQTQEVRGCGDVFSEKLKTAV